MDTTKNNSGRIIRFAMLHQSLGIPDLNDCETKVIREMLVKAEPEYYGKIKISTIEKWRKWGEKPSESEAIHYVRAMKYINRQHFRVEEYADYWRNGGQRVFTTIDNEFRCLSFSEYESLTGKKLARKPKVK